MCFCWELPFQQRNEAKKNGKKTSKQTMTSKSSLSIHTHSRAPAHSPACTHLSFSVLSMHLIFFDVYIHVALQFYVYMTNLFILCFLLVPFHPSLSLSLSLSLSHSNFVFLSLGLQQYHNMTLELNLT